MWHKILITALLALVMAAPALADDKVYINGIDANFPPFAYISADGRPTGFDVDAMNWIAKEMGFQIRHQPMEWSGIVASLKAHKIDMIASGLSVTPQRAEQIAFSTHYWTIQQVVVVHKDSALTLENVLGTGLKVGVQAGTSDAKAMAASNNSNGRKYTIVEYPSSALAAQDVLNGRIDAAVMNDAPAAAAATKLAVKIIGPAGIAEEHFAVGINKDDQQTLQLINEGLKRLMADPYWQKLVEKYKPGEVH